MKKIITNTFEIQNLHDLNFSYKLIEVSINGLEYNRQKEWSKALEKARSQLASLIQTVAVPLFKEGKPYLAIPANKTFQGSIQVNTNPLPAILTLQPRIYNTYYGTGDAKQEEIVYKFLDFAIKEQLGSTEGLGSTGNYSFIDKEIWDNDNGVDIFRGFSYRLMSDNGYAIIPDINFSYVDELFLSKLINNKNVGGLKKSFTGQTFLYFNGDNWYPIEITGFADIISKQTFEREKGQFSIVQDHIFKRNQYAQFNVKDYLNPEDLSILYVYPGRTMKPHIGATSLAKRILPTDDTRVQGLHKISIKKPSIRFEEINQIMNRYFQGLNFNGEPLDISMDPKEEPLKYFTFPALKFRGNKELKVGSSKKDGGRIKLSDIPRFRKLAIERCGLLKQGRFKPQSILVPSYWDKPFAKAVHETFYNELKRLAPDYIDIDDFQLIPWKFNPQLSVTEQLNELKRMLEKADSDSGYGLFILPGINKVSSNYLSNFHDLLKQKFEKKLWFQCASADNIEDFFYSVPSTKNNWLVEYKLRREKSRDFKSYFFYLAMEFFSLQRKWAYSLKNSLNYDIYIGMDSGGRNIGFCVFFRNGEDIFFDYLTIPKKSRNVRKERVNAKKIVEVVLPILERRILKCAPNPNAIVAVKDGKSYGELTKAIHLIIDALDDKLIDKDNLKWGVIDLHKKTATPLRMALPTKNSYERLENPRTGAYKMYRHLEEPEGFLFNTGYPFKVRGSVKPVQFILRDGNVDLDQVIQDMYCQSMMPFSAPNLSNKLPACIKLIDSFLGHTGTAYDEREFREKKGEEKKSPLSAN